MLGCILRTLFLCSLPALTPVQEKTAVLTVIAGEPAQSTTITVAALAKLPHKTVKVPGTEGGTLEYSGVPLVEVLKLAKVPLGEDLRGRAIAPLAVIVEAADGAKAVYALAEVDPSFSDKLILLADKRDGKALGQDEGPYRFVVPSDKRRARWLRQVKTIQVRKL
jgi:hypothetical protein